jgi:hypothetical protein
MVRTATVTTTMVVLTITRIRSDTFEGGDANAIFMMSSSPTLPPGMTDLMRTQKPGKNLYQGVLSRKFQAKMLAVLLDSRIEFSSEWTQNAHGTMHH